MSRYSILIILVLTGLSIQAQDEKHPLHQAIQDDSTQLALFYIGNGSNINEIDKDGFTPLMYAISMNNENIIDALIGAQANVNERDKSGLTTLMHASTVSNPTVVWKLLSAGAEMEAENKGWTALTTACRGGNSETALYLIEQGANVNVKTKDNWSPFLFACAYCNDSLIETFIEKGVDIHETSNSNWTSLIGSLYGGNLKSANYFIENGVDINVIINDSKWNAILYACQYGNDEIIMKLIDRGADIHQRTFDKWNTVMLAIRYGNLESAKLLINKGVDLKKWNTDGWSAITIAARYGNLELIQLIVSKGININMCTNKMYTCLMLAAISNNISIVKYLLEKNAITKMKAMDTKYDAFLIACAYGSPEMVQLFLDRGEKVNKVREGGLSLYVAVSAGNNEVVKLLIDNDARVYSYYLKAALENDNDELSKLFLKKGIEPKEFTGTPMSSYATGKGFMFAAEMNEASGNLLLASQQYQLAATNFDDAVPKLLRQADIFEKGRSGLLLGVLKLGLTIVDISDASKQQYVGYGRLIPEGAGKVSPNEAKKIEFERKATYSREMAAHCRQKLNPK